MLLRLIFKNITNILEKYTNIVKLTFKYKTF